MGSPGEHIIPGGRLALTDGRVRNIRGPPLTEQHIKVYLQLVGMNYICQLQKGRCFKEEGLVHKVMHNEVPPNSDVRVLR